MTEQYMPLTPVAQTRREAASDHVRTQRDIAVTVQSLGALVRQAYAVSGVAS